MKYTLISISALLLVLTACSSTEKKVEPPPATTEPAKTEPEPQVQSRSVDIGAQVGEANEKLAAVSMLALPAFKTSANDEKFESGAARALETAKSVEAQIPEGYVLQITGHSNKHPDASKRTSNSLSVQRARLVYNYFVKNGFPKEKLSYEGVASSQHDEKLTRAQNRRVTFAIVKAGKAEE